MRDKPFVTPVRERQELAAACKVIVSAPQTIEWTPPHAVRFGGLGLTSKLGLRMFVGVGQGSSTEVELGSVRHYQPENKTDEFTRLSPDRHVDLEEQIRHALRKYEDGRFASPASIHILSQFPFYRGLNADAALATALSAALHIYHGDIHAEDLQEITEKHTSELHSDKRYQSIFALAWSLEWATTGFRPEGHHTFSLLVRASLPVAFWRKSDDSASATENPFKTLRPEGCRLAELLTSDQTQADKTSKARERNLHNPMSSLDAALIFLGREADSLEVGLSLRTLVGKKRNERYETAMVSLQSVLRKTPESERPNFASLNPKGEGRKPSDSVKDLLAVHSIETFHALHELVSGGVSSDLLRNVMQQVDRAQDIYRLFGLSSGFIDGPIHVLRSHARRLLRQKVGVRLIGPGRAGCLLIVAARGSLRFALPSLLQRVQRTVNPSVSEGVHCHWFSDIDGYSPEGNALRVEQDFDAGLSLLQEKRPMLVVATWEKGQRQSERSIDQRTWDTTVAHYHMAFDTTVRPHGQIFLKGEPVEIGEKGGVRNQRLQVLDFLLHHAHEHGGDIDGMAFSARLQQFRKAGVKNYTNSEIRSKFIKPISDLLHNIFVCAMDEDDGGKSSLRPDSHGEVSRKYRIRFMPCEDTDIAIFRERRRPPALPVPTSAPEDT